MTKNTLAYFAYKSGIGAALDSIRDYCEFTRVARRDHFSQFGEDSFLLEYFGNRTGVYIDIGGNHPFRLSNTYLLYRRGWTGLVVEPIRRYYSKHKRFRPRDIQVNVAAGDCAGELDFFEMVPAVLSTCDKIEADSVIAQHRARLVSEYSVPVMTLAELHRTYLNGRYISLLSVDTEGHDFQVLEGIAWEAMRPEVVICEANTDQSAANVANFLAERGYQHRISTGCNSIFSLK